MLSLAMYEANTKEEDRAAVDAYRLEYDDAIRELVDAVGSDTMGESMVESTRKLGEDRREVKKRTVPKVPGKVSRTKGTKGGKIGTATRRRGRPRKEQTEQRKSKRR